VNPYAPPAAVAIDRAHSFSRASSEPSSWTIREVLADARRKTMKNLVVLAGSLILSQLVNVGLSFGAAAIVASGALGNPSAPPWWFTLSTEVMSFAVSSFFTVGTTRQQLLAARGGTPTFGQLFGGADRTLAMFFVNILCVMCVFTGALVLIVPAFVVMAGVYCASYLVVDAELGPFDAISESFAATKGQRLKLLGFMTVCSLVAVSGGLMLGVGLIVTVPMSFVAFAIVYARITGRLADPDGRPLVDPTSMAIATA
jgi:hypothetical protein